MGGELLPIYLNDHLAGATAGAELARRALGSNEGTELGDDLALIAAEIEEDRAQLRHIMRRLGAGEDRLKLAGAWAGEKVGRLKPNGRLLGYSPLSRLLEVEVLMLGINGKLLLWRGLRELDDPRLDQGELERLAERAERQLGRLRPHHAGVATEALAAGSAPAQG